MPTKKVAVVGMGITGGVLAYELVKKGFDVHVFNVPKPDSSSRVAAGMFNAIIPRRVTKTWLADELFTCLHSFYPELQEALNTTFYHPKPLFHPFEYNKEQNDWLARIQGTEFSPYFDSTALFFPKFQGLHAPLGAVNIKQAGYCDTSELLNGFRQYFKEQEVLIEAHFDSHQIQFSQGIATYKNTSYDKIVFCEGVANTENPWFRALPFKFAKGELLKVRLPNLGMDQILLGGIFLIPTGDDIYLLGSTYEWDFPDALPTENGKAKLLKRVRDYLPDCRIEILEHRAGIRPAMSDRRPVLGAHPENSSVCIFNGFGSKAISLSPYFAKQMVKFLNGEGAIEEEVDVKRFFES